MKFRREDLVKKATITEVQIQDAQEKLDNWTFINEMMQTRGWEILLNGIDEELGIKDSFKSVDPNFNVMLIRKGYCDGLRKPLQIIDIIKKKATSASEMLKLGLAKNKE